MNKLCGEGSEGFIRVELVKFTRLVKVQIWPLGKASTQDKWHPSAMLREGQRQSSLLPHPEVMQLSRSLQVSNTQVWPKFLEFLRKDCNMSPG